MITALGRVHVLVERLREASQQIVYGFVLLMWKTWKVLSIQKKYNCLVSGSRNRWGELHPGLSPATRRRRRKVNPREDSCSFVPSGSGSDSAWMCVPTAHDDEEEEDEDDLLRRTGNFVASAESLPGGILRVSESRCFLVTREERMNMFKVLVLRSLRWRSVSTPTAPVPQRTSWPRFSSTPRLRLSWRRGSTGPSPSSRYRPPPAADTSEATVPL